MTDQGAPDWFKAYTAAGGQPAAAPAAPRAAGGRPVEPHLDLVRSTAAKHGLNPALLAGVWDFESSGNAGAINRASGATGLGQVMPREAGFRDRPTQQELLDPATNAEWSARILKSGLDRYGSEDKALAAYLGAIDARGNITGAVDANGTGGNQYIRTVRERMQRYGDLISGSVNQTVVPPTPGNVGLARAREALPAATAPADAPDWFKGYASAGGQTAAAQPAPARGGTPAGASSGGQPEWLQLAQTQLGKPYIWGSAGGRTNFDLNAPGYDCSGFVAQVYRNAFGVDIPAFTGNAYPATRAVAQQEAQPGDLVFWNMGTPDPRRQHVAIYIGDGKVIQSGGAGQGVNIAPVGQMPGAEFRRSPAAFARYATQGAPAQTPGTTAPAQPQGLALQGTVATPRASGAPGADAPDWFRGYVSAGGR